MSFYFIHHSACLKAAASAMAPSVSTQVIHHQTKTQFLLAQHSSVLPPLACYSPPAPTALRAFLVYYTATVRERKKRRRNQHSVMLFGFFPCEAVAVRGVKKMILQ